MWGEFGLLVMQRMRPAVEVGAVACGVGAGGPPHVMSPFPAGANPQTAQPSPPSPPPPAPAADTVFPYRWRRPSRGTAPGRSHPPS